MRATNYTNAARQRVLTVRFANTAPQPGAAQCAGNAP